MTEIDANDGRKLRLRLWNENGFIFAQGHSDKLAGCFAINRVESIRTDSDTENYDSAGLSAKVTLMSGDVFIFRYLSNDHVTWLFAQIRGTP